MAAHPSTIAGTGQVACACALRPSSTGAAFSDENDAMQIVLNGTPAALAEAATIAELLDAQGLAERRVAVEVNGAIIPRGRHGEHRLQEGDRVEIVTALGGG